MLTLPFGEVGRRPTSDELCRVCNAPNFNEVSNTLKLDPNCDNFIVFDGLCCVGLLHDEEYVAFELSTLAAVNIVFCRPDALLGVGVTKIREPVHLAIFNRFWVAKYVFYAEIAVEMLNNLLQLRAAAICAPLRVSASYVEFVNGKMQVTSFEPLSSTSICEWALSDESAVEHARELCQSRLEVPQIRKLIEVSESFLKAYDLENCTVPFYRLLSGFRNRASHLVSDVSLEQIPFLWSELCTEVQEAYPDFFEDIAEIDRQR